MSNTNGQKLDQYTLKVLLEKGIITHEDIEKLNNPPERNVTATLKVRDSFNKFVVFLKEKYTENTMSGYKMTIESFLQYLYNVDDIMQIDKDEELKQISTMDIEKWVSHLNANGYSYASIRRFKFSLIKYFEYLSEYGYSSPKLENIKLPEKDEIEINALTDDEVREMADCAQSLRDKVMILFMYETGMRRQELIDCKKEYINFDERTVKIFNKGKFDRVGYFSKEVGKLVQEYISQWEMEVNEINDKRYKRSVEKYEKYKELAISEYLFQSSRSPNISYSTVFKALKTTVYEYFLNKEIAEGMSENEAKKIAEERVESINTDTLRHSRRAYYFAIGKTLDQIQVIMGDENRSVVKRYLKVAQKLYPEKFR